ncbi:MAG TPA: DegT/DnrJ/EryC1/StrS family aminotransferase [Acidisarcina sp.]
MATYVESATAVPLFDLKAQYKGLRDEIRVAIDEVLDSAHYILGPAVAAFERNFASYCEARHGIGVNNGTNAIQLALMAAGVESGDEVITVPHTFVATVAAIRYIGAIPVFVDVEPGSFTMDAAEIEAAITPKTKAILPVHLYGQAAEMDSILEIARHWGLKVIEDCAQAHGATYHGRRVGSIGDYGCFSFYPSKNLGAYGEAGMVTTSHDEGAQTLRMLRDWGQEEKNHHVLRGFNMRMEGMQGAVLGVKLRHLEEWTERRRQCAEYYNNALQGCGLHLPLERTGNRHVYHLYAVRSPNRDALRAALLACGVHSGVHYPIPVHLQQAHADLGYRRGAFPVAERAAETELSIPLFPELTPSQQDQVVAAIRQFARQNRRAGQVGNRLQEFAS